jgi:hypothetical protein
MGAQKTMGLTLGPWTYPSSTSSLALNTVDTWLAIGFICPQLPTGFRLSEVLAYCLGITGSPNLTCSLYSATPAGLPNALIETGSGLTPSANAWRAFIGFTVTASLTPGTQYFLVFKNTVGSTSATIQWHAGNYGALFGNNPAWPCGKYSCTDGSTGPTWGSAASAVNGFRFGVTNGTETLYFGLPLSYLNFLASQTTVSSAEPGSEFLTPNNTVFRLAGISMRVRRAAMPGDLKLKLYEGDALIASSFTVPYGCVQTGSGGSEIPFYFPSQIILKPNTIYRVTIASTTNDSAGNSYWLAGFTIHDSAASKSLIPLNAKQAVLSGGSWTITDTNVSIFQLILSSDLEFSRIQVPRFRGRA